MKKTNLIIAAILILSLAQASSVFAEGPRGLINEVEKFGKGASLGAQKKGEITERQKVRKTNNLNNAKNRADHAIDRRIAKLNKLLQRIQNNQRLSSDDKASLTSDIQSAINGLTALKSKISSDTDLVTLKSDVRQIISGFKVYDIIVPKTQLLITIDSLQTVTTKIAGFTPKIQDLINTLKSEGKDVTRLQNLLDDINNRLTSINNRLSSDKTLVLEVAISTANPKSTFIQVRQDLANIRQNLAQVRHDFAQMRNAFRIIITGGNSGNGSASVSPSATPTPSASPSI